MSDPHHATQHNRGLLLRIAQRAMQERGLLSKFSSDAIAEVNAMHAPASAAVESADVASAPPIRDLTGLLWASIDNDDSRDLDQLTVADNSDMATTRILVAVADVDSLVKDGSAVDRDARHNTTSVYTAAGVFPMLPEKLSTDLTSLNLDAERLAVVVDMTIAADGSVANSELYRALVRNRAKLAYNSVAPWLDGNGEVPPGVASIDGLAENLRVQGRVAERMKALRHVHGALNLETLKARPIFDGDRMSGLAEDRKNSATELISNFMIAANGVTARYLATKNSPSIRRVVRTPKRWNRIVDLAQEHGVALPANPDSVALDGFLALQQANDPQRFPDLSLAIVKLLGAGEYVAEQPGVAAPGHFGLAVKDYAHSTAPNRRYPDLVTQRLLKAAIVGRPSPYAFAELDEMAKHFTEEEDAANKVERQVGKSAAAMLLERRISEQFDALVTGASPKGTWARLLSMPVEGRVVRGFEGMDVGDEVRVELLSVDIERGFIDFGGVDSRRR